MGHEMVRGGDGLMRFAMVDPDSTGSSLPTVASRSHERAESLRVQDVREFFNAGVAIAAAATWVRIQEKAATTGLPPVGATPQEKDIFKEWKKGLDDLATADLRIHFAGAPFGISVLGSEGKKELRKDNIKVDSLEGLHGKKTVVGLDKEGQEIEEIIPEMELFADPIEGTTAAAGNNIGSVAIVGGGLENGHNMVPAEDGDAHYMLRTVAGPKLNGRISLDMSPRDVVAEAMSAFNLRSPSELKVVVLGGKTRTRNNELKRGYREAGATVEEIEAGDLMPALDTLRNKPIISVGSGGKEEAMIAAIAARALGGFFEGRYVDTDGNQSKDHPGRLTLDDLCPGDPEKYFVSLAAITGTPDVGLNLFRVMPRGSNGHTLYEVRVVDITNRGLFRWSHYEVNLNDRTVIRV